MNVEADKVTPTESGVAEVWTAVLNHDQFGPEDNFFAVGGHSLYATLVIYQLRDIWSIEFPLSFIFEYSTVRELASAIDRAKAEAAESDAVTG
ncbi:phosphopantetheine-binding protein [Streptomyces sp. SPB162]|uniref:phosphopantetheine-binding protein n=1 Tax=Streptomyces sp. SPB162 TaxID=2940560 RepID=UPI0024052D4F|nr:phosphopantetheine-binding protein [Streptomyces sp. SPB162]